MAIEDNAYTTTARHFIESGMPLEFIAKMIEKHVAALQALIPDTEGREAAIDGNTKLLEAVKEQLK